MELRRQNAHIAHGTKGERSTDHGRQGEDRRNRLAHPGGAPEERAHELRRARPPGRPVRPGGSRACEAAGGPGRRSEEHTSELQSLMRISYAVFCLKKKKQNKK